MELPAVEGPMQAVMTPLADSNAPEFQFKYQTEKQKYKNEIKKEVGKKFTVGETLILKTKIKNSSKIIKKEFIVKKFIYTVNQQNVSILVLKRVSSSEDTDTKFTLNINDCKTLHIKFEPGLEVWPMNLNWIHKKEK